MMFEFWEANFFGNQNVGVKHHFSMNELHRGITKNYETHSRGSISNCGDGFEIKAQRGQISKCKLETKVIAF